MADFFDIIKYALNPEWIFTRFGSMALLVLLLIIFAETGLFVGFFLPGDSLLFTAGIFNKKLSHSFYNVSFIVIILMVALSAVLGNIVGYWFGYKSGHLLFKKKILFFSKKNI